MPQKILGLDAREFQHFGNLVELSRFGMPSFNLLRDHCVAFSRGVFQLRSALNFCRSASVPLARRVPSM
jgi:hypothetical protein